ncbi:hypothetical protein DFJ77DRAFT_232946 [Powellomyces hirtus]|nr:hypothetical protein DFJ77DRAFT_232946 [Powellomyces hirtus]
MAIYAPLLFIISIILVIIATVLLFGRSWRLLKQWRGPGGGFKHPFRYLSLLTLVFMGFGQIIGAFAGALAIVCIRDAMCPWWSANPEEMFRTTITINIVSNFFLDMSGGLYAWTLLERFEMFIPILNWSPHVIPRLRIWFTFCAIVGYGGHVAMWQPYFIARPTLRWAVAWPMYVHWIGLIIGDMFLSVTMVYTFRKIQGDLGEFNDEQTGAKVISIYTNRQRPVNAEQREVRDSSFEMSEPAPLRSQRSAQSVSRRELERRLTILVSTLVCMDIMGLACHLVPSVGGFDSERYGDELAWISGCIISLHIVISLYFLSYFSKSMLRERSRPNPAVSLSPSKDPILAHEPRGLIQSKPLDSDDGLE